MGSIRISSQGTEFPPGAADGARLVLTPRSLLRRSSDPGFGMPQTAGAAPLETFPPEGIFTP